MKQTIQFLPRSKQDWVHLWYSASATLVVAMVLKEAPVNNRSDGRVSFHWSYDLTLFIAIISLFVASSKVRSRGLAILGCVVAIAGWSFLGRPEY